MTQASPEELQEAYESIESKHPLASSDDSLQNETICAILEHLPEASIYNKLLKQHPNLVALLSDTSNGEYTLFLPVDKAWGSPSGLEERVITAADSNVLSMHISEHYINEAYPRGMTNIPSIFEPDTCNGPQAFSIQLTQDGWMINKSGRFTRSSLRACNGIIYFIDQVILPPAPLLDVLRSKGNFSTLIKAMSTFGFDLEFAAQRGRGGTLFAPTDMAFASLGPEALGFLIGTAEGNEYLKAILELHFCPDYTFFSNFIWPKNNGRDRRTSADKDRIIKGKQTQQLAAILKVGDKSPKLAISLTRYMSLITMSVNSVAVVEQDIGGSDGVAHAINDILLPDGAVGKETQDFISRIKAALDPFM